MATTHGVTVRELELAMASDDDDIDSLLAACENTNPPACTYNPRACYVCRACGVDTATAADGKCACWGY
jgi:hypothetical protein